MRTYEGSCQAVEICKRLQKLVVSSNNVIVPTTSKVRMRRNKNTYKNTNKKSSDFTHKKRTTFVKYLNALSVEKLPLTSQNMP